MNNHEKIATIFIRVSALCLFATGVAYWGIIAVGVLLAVLEINSYASTGLEVYFIQSVFILIIASVLYIRSKSLARYIAAGFQDDDKSAPQD